MHSVSYARQSPCKRALTNPSSRPITGTGKDQTGKEYINL